MHQITVLLLALLFLTFIGCEDKKPEQSSIPVENTTTIIMQETQTNKINEVAEVKEIEDTTAIPVETTEEIIIKPKEVEEEISIEPKRNVGDTFEFFDTKEETYTATITQEGLKLQNNVKPIVLIQFFATWCAPCVGEIAYLNDLQEANQEDLFVSGILTRDTVDTSSLNTFMEEHSINYKILQNKEEGTLGKYIAQELHIQGTFPIPLIIMYLNGKYYTHYEGSIPVEMIRSDIKQAQKELNHNE